MSSSIDQYLRERIEAGDLPGAAYAVATPEGFLALGAVGDAAIEPERIPAATDTIYDLASLTKPLVTSFLLLRLGRELGLREDLPVSRILHEVDRQDKKEITIGQLLTHTSGLPDWVPFYLSGETMGDYLRQIRVLEPVARPGAGVIYSCLGYIMLGELIARSATMGLDGLAEQLIWRPLGLRHTAYNPPREWRASVAATEDSCQYERKLTATRSAGYAGYRTGIIHGEVHDQNAWVLGGVAGNAGLFSTARETAVMALEYLGDGGGLLGAESLERARRDRTVGLNEARSDAFRIALRGATAAGPDLPGTAFGHNGFTGTSIWIDPERARVYVLLTNRVHPRVSETVDMTAVRSGFHSVASRI
ncbi:MAG TPA: serine hydrolase domain-containing protein [Candidatus Polarisedimenticolia bacterium]|nr:serine hydrolase domain-containing protein [Candidatus Polarisedimenticolia bacterium]